MFSVLGSTSVDVVVRAPRGMPRADGDEFTSASLVFCDAPLRFSPGGNACNSAYVLAALGAEALLCSAVGEDELGAMMLGWLHEAGVGLAALKRAVAGSTSSTTIVSAGESRLSFHHSGALASYDPADLPEQVLASTDVLLVCAYPLLMRWRPEGYLHLLRTARDHGVTTALDIGPAVGPTVTLAELEPMLPYVNYFVCNGLELERCTGSQSLVDGMGLIAEAGASSVVTKLGPRGAAVLQSDRRKADVVPGFSVRERGTVGAGDAFNAGFLFALREGYDLVRAVRFGNATASLVVASDVGVQVRPSRIEVERLLAD